MRLLLLALFLIAAAGGWFYIAGGGRKVVAETSAPEPAVPVVAQPVKRSDVPVYLRGIGTVSAYNTVWCEARSRARSSKSPLKKGRP
jgi:membrane fusion protein, multidrug efflux system